MTISNNVKAQNISYFKYPSPVPLCATQEILTMENITL